MEKVNSNKSRKVVGIILSILIVIILAYIGTVIITSRNISKVEKDINDYANGEILAFIPAGKSEYEVLSDFDTVEYARNEMLKKSNVYGDVRLSVPDELKNNKKLEVFGVNSDKKLNKIASDLIPNDKGIIEFKKGSQSFDKYILVGVSKNPTIAEKTPQEREDMIKEEHEQRQEEKKEQEGSSAGNNQGSARTGDFWSDAGSWFGDAQNENKEAGLPAEAQNIIKIFADMINIIGTSIIALVTIILGIKYMYGSVNDKVSVKESLPDLLVACVFFFGWSSIRTLLMPNDVLVFMGAPGESYQSLVARIFGIGMYIANFLVVAAVIYVGVRYIFSGAEGKAGLKVKSPQFILGIIMAFAASTFLTFVSSVINQIFAG